MVIIERYARNILGKHDIKYKVGKTAECVLYYTKYLEKKTKYHSFQDLKPNHSKSFQLPAIRKCSLDYPSYDKISNTHMFMYQCIL